MLDLAASPERTDAETAIEDVDGPEHALQAVAETAGLTAVTALAAAPRRARQSTQERAAW
jgi:hypothetical protein